MREYMVKYPLKQGMRPSIYTKSNSGFLYDAKGVRIGEYGLETPYNIYFESIGGSRLKSQVIRLAEYENSNGIYFLCDDYGYPVFYRYDYPNFTQVFRALDYTDYRFSVADFGAYKFMTSGDIMVEIWVGTYGKFVWKEYRVTRYNDLYFPSCVCNLRGQLIAAIPTSDGYVIAWSEIGSFNPLVMFNPSHGFIDRQFEKEYTETTSQFYPSHSRMDGYWDANSSIYNYGYSYFRVGKEGGYSYSAWITFDDIDIPQGAEITSAKIQFRAYYSNSNYAYLRCFFGAYDQGEIPYSNDECKSLILGDPIYWENVPNWVVGNYYWTPELKDIFQTIINRSGWRERNRVTFVLQEYNSNTTGNRTAYSYDSVSGKPLLEVSWKGYKNTNPIKPWKNTSGNLKIGKENEVKRIIPLDKNAIIYTRNEIFALTPAGTTFGIIPLAKFGIESMWNAGGDDNGHICISNADRSIWRILPDLKLVRLGYEEYMGELELPQTKISKVREKGDYFIADMYNAKCFLLTDWGMSRFHLCPNSIELVDQTKEYVGLGMESSHLGPFEGGGGGGEV